MYKRNYYVQLIDQDLRTVDIIPDINPEQIKHMRIYNLLAIKTIIIVLLTITILLSGCLIHQHMLYTKHVNNLSNELSLTTDQLNNNIQTDIILSRKRKTTKLPLISTEFCGMTALLTIKMVKCIMMLP
jgi:uncharacterized protein YpmS